MKKIYFSCLFFIFTQSFSEIIDSTNYKLILKFTPQHLIIRNLRFEIEYLIGKKNHAVVVSPNFYGGFGKSNFDNTSNDKILGFGVDVFYKNFIYKISPDEVQTLKIYFSPGLHFHKINAEIFDKGYFENQNEFGQKVIEYGYHEFEQNIQKTAISFSFGLNYHFLKRVIVEPYFGLIRNFSSIESNDLKDLSERYTENMWDYGYKGFTPRLGFHVGLILF